MYCPNCGLKNEKVDQFCASCGTKLTDEKLAVQEGSKVFYSEGWPRAKTLAIAVVPVYDLMVDEENFYVIKLPSSSASAWGLFIGLIFGRLIGAAIGVAIGEAIAASKRKSVRNTYINENNNLTSSGYESYTFLKIPLKDLKHHINFQKEKFLAVKYNTGAITLRKGKKEYSIVKDYLKKYVL